MSTSKTRLLLYNIKHFFLNFSCLVDFDVIIKSLRIWKISKPLGSLGDQQKKSKDSNVFYPSIITFLDTFVYNTIYT